MPPTRGTAERRAGNAARDRQDWADAVLWYERYLAMRPSDSAIRVQYGHVLVENGRHDDGRAAYRDALRQRPDDLDLLAHLAALLRRMGRVQEALDVQETAARLPQAEGLSFLTGDTGEAKAEPVGPLPAGTVLYSVQDMLGYLNVHSSFSGIQRVQAGIANYLLDTSGEAAQFILSAALEGSEPGKFWLLDKSSLRALIDYASGEEVNAYVLRQLLARCVVTARPVDVGEGHTIIVLGAFWGHGNTPMSLWPAKRSGAKIGVYIYDIIPVSHPQFCVDDLVIDFCQALAQMLQIADFILTISDYTRLQLSALMDDHGFAARPMATVPLAHDMTRRADEKSWPQALTSIDGRPFVAYVSTIEGRKNHIFVVKIWADLIDRGIDVPELVFIGRRGWRNDELYDLLEKTDNLNGRVHIAHDLTDAELNAVYAQAVFTVFTSVVEGWGLPIGESLMHGTPCIASDTSSMPEVGGDFVDYIDPFDLEKSIAVLKKAICDPTYIIDRKNNILENFRPRSWANVGEHFVGSVGKFIALADITVEAPHLKAGHLYPFSRAKAPVETKSVLTDPVNALVLDSFYHSENFGAWMRGDRGTIEFRCHEPQGTPIFVYIGVCTSDIQTGIRLRLDVGGMAEIHDLAVANLALPSDPVAASITRLGAIVGVDGRVMLNMSLDAAVPERPLDHRNFLIGVRALGYSTHVGPDRFEMLETILFFGLCRL